MYVSIDIGGTKTRIASSRNLKDLFRIVKFPSSWNLKEEKSNILRGIEEVSGGTDVKVICVGVPGRVDYLAEKFFKLPNYSVLNDFPFDFLLGGRFKKTKLLVENDAALAGLGEAVMGAGLTSKVMAYLTLSTGVGGVRVEKTNKSINYFYAEPGHQIILKDGKYNTGTGHKGSLESYVSGRAFEDIYGVKPDKCETQAYWNDYATHLAVGIHNISAMWMPELVVLGGSLSKKYPLFKLELKRLLAAEKFITVPKIVTSEFADDSGLVGGLVKIGLSQSRFTH